MDHFSGSRPRIQADVCLPADITDGDLIVFMGTGAYAEMMSSNMNGMPRPSTVLVNGEDESLIRRRETLEDVYRRDEMPTWLNSESNVVVKTVAN